MRPLNSPKGNSHLFEVMDVFELCEHAIVEIRFHIKSSHTAIVKLQIERKILIRSNCDNFLHVVAPYFSGSILKTDCPLTAKRQSAMSSSWWISIHACTNLSFAALSVPSSTVPSGMEMTASSSLYCT